MFPVLSLSVLLLLVTNVNSAGLSCVNAFVAVTLIVSLFTISALRPSVALSISKYWNALLLSLISIELLIFISYLFADSFVVLKA